MSRYFGDIAQEVYKRNSQKYDLEINNIEEEIEQTKNRKTIDIGPFKDLAEYGKNIYKIYKNGSYEIKRKCLGFFWEKFIVEDREIISAEPTLLFKSLLQLQNPPVKEDFESKNSVSNKRDLPQPQRSTECQKNFSKLIINLNGWGA